MIKRTKKGFTLIELIVVMAIFSILMVAVMALTGPVSRLFSKTAISEKTYSYANNIQLYLQGKLEYAEDVYVCTSDKIDFNGANGVDSEDLAELAERFRKEHFKNTVSYDGSKANYIKGNIHIIRLLNNDQVNDSGDVVFKRGEITHRVYDFTSNNTIDSTKNPTEISELNPAFFNATDATYNYSYALGSSNLKVVDLPADSNFDTETASKIDRKQVYRALDKDIVDDISDISATTLSVSIVLDKKSGGSIDVPAVGTAKAYRAFVSPVAVQIANLPLTNIATRTKRNPSPKGLTRPKMDAVGGAVALQGEGDIGYAYSQTYASSSFDFNNDIYFVYAYTDELR